MRFSAPLRMSSLISLVAIITIVSGFLLGGLVFHTAPTHASNAPVYHAIPGTLTPSGRVDLRKLSTISQPLSSAATFPKGARRVHHGVGSMRHAPGLISSSPVTRQLDSLITSFNGASSRDSAITNFGLEFEPPDQGLCAGNGLVLEAVNSAFSIYHTDGSIVTGPFNVNVLFDEGLRAFTSDPRCYFDKSTKTWFAIILFINNAGTRARTDIAVNPSGDPTTPWTVYRLEATDDGTQGTPSHPGCPCFGDQPLLGIDQFNLYVSTNEFSILGPQFNGAQIYALSKSDLISLARSVHFVHFDNLGIGGAIATSVQPAISIGSPGAEYFLNALDPFGTFDNRLGVWAMTNRQAVSHGHIPALSSLVIISEPYGMPPGAQQKGANSLLDSGDDRMQQVEYINGSVWGALDTAVTIPNDSAERAGAAWFEVRPRLDSSGQLIKGAAVLNQGYIATLGNYLLYPAMVVSPQDTAAVVMTLSGQDYFPSAVYTELQQGRNNFGAIHLAAMGTGPYDPKATRWGDYSWATLDPGTNNFWLATEYIPPKSSQTPDRLRNWGTRVMEVKSGS